MPYTLVADSTTAAAKLVYVADNGLTNIVGGADVTQTGTMPASTVGGHPALGAGAAADNYLSAAIGGAVGAGVPYAVLIVGEFGNSSDTEKPIIAYPGSSAIRPAIHGQNRPPRQVNCCTPYVGLNWVGTVTGGAWIGSGEQVIICGRNAANKMGGSLNGAASVFSNYTDGSLSGGTLSASDVIRFGGSPVTNSGLTGLAGFAVSMFAVFVGITPDALNAYIGTNPWAMVVAPSSTSTQITATTADATFSGASVGYSASSSSQIAATTEDAVFSGGSVGDSSTGTVTTSEFKNESGTLLTALSVDKVWAIQLSGTPTFSSAVTNGAGQLVLSGAALTPGVDYLIVSAKADGSAVGVTKHTAT